MPVSLRYSGIPRYCRQKRRGRADLAYIVIDGKRHWLGTYGTSESRRKYAELIGQESPVVRPVPTVDVELTLEHLPEVVADMVRVQFLTGMRPSECCRMRPCGLDRSGDVWTYRPSSHKTTHLDHGCP